MLIGLFLHCPRRLPSLPSRLQQALLPESLCLRRPLPGRKLRLSRRRPLKLPTTPPIKWRQASGVRASHNMRTSLRHLSEISLRDEQRSSRQAAPFFTASYLSKISRPLRQQFAVRNGGIVFVTYIETTLRPSRSQSPRRLLLGHRLTTSKHVLYQSTPAPSGNQRPLVCRP